MSILYLLLGQDPVVEQDVQEDEVALRPDPGGRILELLLRDGALEVPRARAVGLVDVSVVGGVVLVVGRRLEDRRLAG